MNTPDPREGLPSSSSMYRYAACPGSWRMSKGLADHKTHEMAEYAASGDRVHNAIAIGLPDKLPDPDEREVAERCVEQRVELVTRLLGDQFVSVREERLWLFHENFKLLSGQPDDVSFTSDTGLVIDYKSGRGEQADAASNMQIRTNIVLASRVLAPSVTKWYGVIIQPLITSKPVVVEYSKNLVQEAHGEILMILNAIHKHDSPTKAGSHCKFCPAVFTCPSARSLLEQFKLVAPAEAEGSNIASLLELAKSARPIIDRIEARAKELIKNNPDAVPGWTIGKGSSQRSVSDTLKCYALLVEAGLADRDTFLRDIASVKMGDMEKSVAAFKGLKKSVAKDTVNAVCLPVIAFIEKAGSLERVQETINQIA